MTGHRLSADAFHKGLNVALDEQAREEVARGVVRVDTSDDQLRHEIADKLRYPGTAYEQAGAVLTLLRAKGLRV